MVGRAAFPRGVAFASKSPDGMVVPSRRFAGCLLVILAASCDPYDAGLLQPVSVTEHEAPVCGDGKVEGVERCDTAIPPGQQGFCPFECTQDDPCNPQVVAGSACQTQCAGLTITLAQTGDGCCPEGVGAAEDGDCGSCGDSIVGPVETCDPPSECHTQETCPQGSACIGGVFSGDPALCTSRCNIVLIDDCADDDDCCPAGCTNATDNDCSQECGDAIVQSTAGETCEPASEESPCPESCDDGFPCTTDVKAGSVENCNVECASVDITVAADGDGCCPPGIYANADNDCVAQCGNLVLEPGESCDDGGSQCDGNCQRAIHSSLAHRYSFTSSAADSVGNDDGTLQDGASISGGAVTLSGGDTGGYVQLPAGMVSSHTSITVEVWVDWTPGAIRQRLFECGGKQTTEGTNFMFITPRNSSDKFATYLNFTPAVNDVSNDRIAADTGQLTTTDPPEFHQVAATFDAVDRTLSLYLDGSSKASTPVPVDTVNDLDGLADIDDDFCYLGHSVFDNPDEFGGVVTELRIYDHALSAQEIAVSNSMGADP
jgi:hypothetical protein